MARRQGKLRYSRNWRALSKSALFAGDFAYFLITRFTLASPPVAFEASTGDRQIGLREREGGISQTSKRDRAVKLCLALFGWATKAMFKFPFIANKKAGALGAPASNSGSAIQRPAGADSAPFS
jgi:hypothetical protein